MWDIKAEIDKRKMYLLGRITRSSDGRAHKRIYKRRFIRGKWNFDKKMAGFIPDITRVLTPYNILPLLRNITVWDKSLRPPWIFY